MNCRKSFKMLRTIVPYPPLLALIFVRGQAIGYETYLHHLAHQLGGVQLEPEDSNLTRVSFAGMYSVYAYSLSGGRGTRPIASEKRQ